MQRYTFIAIILSILLVGCNSGNGNNINLTSSNDQDKSNLNQNSDRNPFQGNSNGDYITTTSISSLGDATLQTSSSMGYRVSKPGIGSKWHSLGSYLPISVTTGLSFGSRDGYILARNGAVGVSSLIPNKDGEFPWNWEQIPRVPSALGNPIAMVRVRNFLVAITTNRIIYTNVNSGLFWAIMNVSNGPYTFSAITVVENEYGTNVNVLGFNQATNSTRLIIIHVGDVLNLLVNSPIGPDGLNEMDSDDEGVGNAVFAFDRGSPASSNTSVVHCIYSDQGKVNCNTEDTSITEPVIDIAVGNQLALGVGEAGSIIIRNTSGQWSKVFKFNQANFEAKTLIFVPSDASETGIFILTAKINGQITNFSSTNGIIWTSAEIPRFSYMKAGSNSICAFESAATTRSIYCWGNNESGQLGFGSSGGIILLPKPTTLSNLISAQIAVGGTHACALTLDGHFPGNAYCWGNNSNGQLGNRTYTSSNVPIQITLESSGISLTRIYSGNAFSCAVDSDKQVWCWGNNSYGQLGIDPRSSPNSPNPVQIQNFSTLTSADRFALGNNHACAISSQHYLYCWGNNSSGQLGIGASISYSISPTRVKLSSSDPQVSKVYAGGDDTCAIDVNGLGYCWGRNSSGQVGNGKITPQVNTPTMIDGDYQYKELHPSSLHTCGITSQSVGLCWGDNSYGEIGNGKVSKLPQDTPYIITGQNKWVNMTTGYGFTCATDLYEGRNYCWGKNDLGAVGINSLESIEPTPLSINSY